MAFWKLLSRALRLRCPRCGQDKLFRRWFRMFPQCANCGLKYERESGFFLGAIYFNYGLTALLIAIVYPVLTFTRTLPPGTAALITLPFAVLFPLWFFRYARSLWLGFDYYFDPR